MFVQGGEKSKKEEDNVELVRKREGLEKQETAEGGPEKWGGAIYKVNSGFFLPAPEL